MQLGFNYSPVSPSRSDGWSTQWSRTLAAGWQRRHVGWSAGGREGSLGGRVASAAPLPLPSLQHKAVGTNGATTRVVAGARSGGGTTVEHGDFGSGVTTIRVVGGGCVVAGGAADVCVNGGDGATRVGANGLSLDGDCGVRTVERGWQSWRPCGLDSFPSTQVAAWWPHLFPLVLVVRGDLEAPSCVRHVRQDQRQSPPRWGV
jgi:hypothetical protein